MPATLQLIGCDSKFYLGIKVTLFDSVTISESGFFLTLKQSSWERDDSEKSMIRKKEKVKQEVLLHHYKLPSWLSGDGGDQIFKKMEIMSRKEYKSMNSTGHEIAYGETIASTERKSSILGDMSLYWPSPYGLTSIDFYSKD